MCFESVSKNIFRDKKKTKIVHFISDFELICKQYLNYFRKLEQYF